MAWTPEELEQLGEYGKKITKAFAEGNSVEIRKWQSKIVELTNKAMGKGGPPSPPVPPKPTPSRGPNYDAMEKSLKAQPDVLHVNGHNDFKLAAAQNHHAPGAHPAKPIHTQNLFEHKPKFTSKKLPRNVGQLATWIILPILLMGCKPNAEAASPQEAYNKLVEALATLYDIADPWSWLQKAYTNLELLVNVEPQTAQQFKDAYYSYALARMQNVSKLGTIAYPEPFPLWAKEHWPDAYQRVGPPNVTW